MGNDETKDDRQRGRHHTTNNKLKHDDFIFFKGGKDTNDLI